MLLRVARQTIVAAIVIALMAAGWQLATGADAAGAGGAPTLARVHHDDD
jgi:hypothetical protein